MDTRLPRRGHCWNLSTIVDQMPMDDYEHSNRLYGGRLAKLGLSALCMLVLYIWNITEGEMMTDELATVVKHNAKLL